MTNHYQILIVGGGNAGISVAAQLLRKNIGLQIAIMDPADRHYYQPAWTLVGAGIFDVQKTIRQEKDVLPKNLVWIKEAAAAFCPDSNTVTTTVGHEYVYDWLIVCPGIQIDWHKIKGLRETLGHNNVSSNYEVASAPYTWEMIKHFKGGNALFTNPPNPIKCGGAPHKIMYLAVDYWRKKGILNQCNVHYLSGGGVLFGIKEYAATLQKVVDDNHIHTHFGVNVVEIDTKAQQVYYEEKDTEGILHRKAMHFDFCHAVAPQSAPDFIKNSPLRDPNNAQGYVAVDQYTLQHIRYPNVFALGDCINAPCSKTGAAIRKQAPVVVANLLAVMAGQLPTAQYNGYSACPIPTQYGKLMLAEFDYSNTAQMTFPFNQAKPRWSMWLLKTKVLPWLYWHKILKGTA